MAKKKLQDKIALTGGPLKPFFWLEWGCSLELI
jgi:hypothetical protein